MAEPAGHAVSTSRVDVAPDALSARLSRARAMLAPTPDPGLTDALRAARCALDPEYARQVERELQFRHDCGNATHLGIYVRDDPATVPFPREDE